MKQGNIKTLMILKYGGKHQNYLLEELLLEDEDGLGIELLIFVISHYVLSTFSKKQFLKP